MSCRCDHHERCDGLRAILTVGLTLAGALLGPHLVRFALEEWPAIEIDVVNTLFMLGLAMFIAVIGLGIVTAERPLEPAAEADPRGVHRP
jgi:heme A synthase